jgi:hypothetical protein
VKRIVTSVLCAGLLIGLAGCGGSGIEEGMPEEGGTPVKLDPKMVDMSGRSFKDAGKADAKAAQAKAAAEAEASKK